MNQHTVKAYGDELNQITAEVARMGGLAERQVADAASALIRRDVEQVTTAIGRDGEIDALEREVSHDVMRLALRGPLAAVQACAERLVALRGVRHGVPVIVSLRQRL